MFVLGSGQSDWTGNVLKKQYTSQIDLLTAICDSKHFLIVCYACLVFSTMYDSGSGRSVSETGQECCLQYSSQTKVRTE
jgi:hypothetical protein